MQFELCEVVTTLTLLWTAAVFPSPPDLGSPLLLPVCQLEATSSSSCSKTDLSGHNRLPLQLCCFWKRNPSAPLVLPLGWQKLAMKTLFFISADKTSTFFCSKGFVYFHSSLWKKCDHGHPAEISSRCEVIQLDYHLWHVLLAEQKDHQVHLIIYLIFTI